MAERILVSDFDGTISRRDFYSCVVEELLDASALQPWHEYVAGRLTHFEALRQIFAQIRAGEEALETVFGLMEVEPELGSCVENLRKAGWDIVVVSNGCGWYIEKFLQRAGVEVPVHTNPGRYHPDTGLEMMLPVDSPFFDPEVGISKGAVVRAMQGQYGPAQVAFAGDGRPDVDPALCVDPERRYAREWLAGELTRLGEPFQRIERWRDVVSHLTRTESGS